MKFSKIIFSLALLCAASCQTHKQCQHLITVGLQSGYPPFEYVNEEGQVVGFDVDLSHDIADLLGKQLVIEEMDFDGEILALKQGKIDAIISGMNITPSRSQEIAMIPYHGDKLSSLCLLFWNKIPDKVRSFEDLLSMQDAVISVEAGTTGELFLEHCPQIKHRSFEGSLAALLDVQCGKSLAQIVDPDVATYLMKHHPEITSLPIPLPDNEAIFGFGIGVRKENQSLLHELEEAVRTLKESGELKRLEQKWFEGGGQ